ncbi:MAG: hypothetical protein M1830_009540 [Pleopsidium flavum]|nr:MAG: hypothetical protein M1830_009540 [Pleopsidium flavum]
MPTERYLDEEEAKPLTQDDESQTGPSRDSLDSVTSASTTSLVFERLNDSTKANGNGSLKQQPHQDSLAQTSDVNEKEDDYDIEEGTYQPPAGKSVDKRFRRIIWMLGALSLGGWVLALFLFLSRQTYKHSSAIPHDPAATASRGSGKKVTLDQVLGGLWRPKSHEISWIAGANGEDGLLLERNHGQRSDYLVVEDVRSRNGTVAFIDSMTLMKDGAFKVSGGSVYPSKVWPSRNLKKVLVMSEEQRNWRHSFTGKYWIFDVATQKGEALDPANPDVRIQLASWSPESDAVVFTRNNNLFLRTLSSSTVKQITTDGGSEQFYGVPDWVYEEEVFQGNSVTWWAEDGNYIAFLRTNESAVPEYPIQYFVSRPSGKKPASGEENYPEVRDIKYPKAGAPNPVVDLQFYDVEKNDVFTVEIGGDFPDADRLITEIVWAGKSGKVLLKETNRESDILKVVLIDVTRRTGQVVRTTDVNGIDGGWFEVSEDTRYIPGDPGNGRPHDGYIDTVIHEGYDHLAYFTPLDNPHPIPLTSGTWEVVKAPSAVDLNNNLVYFVATKESPIQRHVYSVKLDGSDLKSITDTKDQGYYGVSFSKGAGYALLTYDGPGIPWQRVISTPSNKDLYEDVIEENVALTKLAAEHELPIQIYQNVTIDGYTLQVVERRPPHFNPKKQYPVLFHLYGGPGSQTVDKKFTVDFQAYVAANLGYVVVTIDGRGTGFIGRKARCIIRGNIGYYEARDQIETAKIWAMKKYVDASRMAIWGWSYGGFMTLKTLEQDGGRTFRYGMAVAPVTDWRFYDSVYTERYMHTPQHNLEGYNNSTISNMTALKDNVRFLFMHGVADDNVHMQNSLTLIDKLDLAGVENYDVHVFPDSDHSIYFHNANKMVYDRLNSWLVNAFNGEWLRTENAVPLTNVDVSSRRR